MANLSWYHGGRCLPVRVVQLLDKGKAVYLNNIENSFQSEKKHSEIIIKDKNNINSKGYMGYKPVVKFSENNALNISDGYFFDVEPAYVQLFTTDYKDGIYQTVEMFKTAAPVLPDNMNLDKEIEYTARLTTGTTDRGLSRYYDRGSETAVFVKTGYDEYAESLVGKGLETISTTSAKTKEDYINLSVNYQESRTILSLASKRFVKPYNELLTDVINDCKNASDMFMVDANEGLLHEHMDRVTQEAESLPSKQKFEQKSNDRIYKSSQRGQEINIGVNPDDPYGIGDLSEYETICP